MLTTSAERYLDLNDGTLLHRCVCVYGGGGVCVCACVCVEGDGYVCV